MLHESAGTETAFAKGSSSVDQTAVKDSFWTGIPECLSNMATYVLIHFVAMLGQRTD